MLSSELAMNSVDFTILNALNHCGLHSEAFDGFMGVLAENLLLKGGVVMAVIWWLWFHAAKNEQTAKAIQRRIIIGFCATALALVIVRAAHLALPYRPRPLNYPGLFTLPYGLSDMDRAFMQGDSSFPSDHATLFYSLATIIFLVSRRVGIVSFIYVTLFICLPRVYLLIHYPTDIFVGGLIGIVCVAVGIWLGESVRPLQAFAHAAIRWSQKFPGAFYAMMFVWSFSIAELFDSMRSLGHIGPVLRKLLGQH
jgi:undecaprenyl-diphosphatase